MAAQKPSLLQDFRAFAIKGNVVELAVAVIIGAAFGRIVTSLVNDIVMPPIGYLTGGVDFTDLFITLGPGEYSSLAEAQAAGAATINYGLFLNAIISFLIVAWAVFLMVRMINRLKRKDADLPPAAPPPPSKEALLLEEIRDLLRQRRS